MWRTHETLTFCSRIAHINKHILYSIERFIKTVAFFYLKKKKIVNQKSANVNNTTKKRYSYVCGRCAHTILSNSNSVINAREMFHHFHFLIYFIYIYVVYGLLTCVWAARKCISSIFSFVFISLNSSGREYLLCDRNI